MHILICLDAYSWVLPLPSFSGLFTQLALNSLPFLAVMIIAEIYIKGQGKIPQSLVNRRHCLLASSAALWIAVELPANDRAFYQETRTVSQCRPPLWAATQHFYGKDKGAHWIAFPEIILHQLK